MSAAPDPRRVGRLIAGLLALSTASALVVWLHAPTPVRAPAALLLVLVLPGCPWLLYHHRPRHPPETVALTVAASLGLTMIIGLLINLLPWGLTSGSWSVGMLVVSLLGLVNLWVRTRQPELAPPPPSPADRRVRPRRASLGRLALRAGGGGLALALLAWLAVVSVRSQHAAYRREHFTVLSLDRASADVLTVGVVDHEEATVSYRLVAVSQGSDVFTRRISLRSGHSAAVAVRVPGDTVLLDSPLIIRLSREGQHGVYRSLTLWPREGRWP